MELEIEMHNSEIKTIDLIEVYKYVSKLKDILKEGEIERKYKGDRRGYEEIIMYKDNLSFHAERGCASRSTASTYKTNWPLLGQL